MSPKGCRRSRRGYQKARLAERECPAIARQATRGLTCESGPRDCSIALWGPIEGGCSSVPSDGISRVHDLEKLKAPRATLVPVVVLRVIIWISILSENSARQRPGRGQFVDAKALDLRCQGRERIVYHGLSKTEGDGLQRPRGSVYPSAISVAPSHGYMQAAGRAL